MYAHHMPAVSRKAVSAVDHSIAHFNMEQAAMPSGSGSSRLSIQDVLDKHGRIQSNSSKISLEASISHTDSSLSVQHSSKVIPITRNPGVV